MLAVLMVPGRGHNAYKVKGKGQNGAEHPQSHCTPPSSTQVALGYSFRDPTVPASLRPRGHCYAGLHWQMMKTSRIHRKRQKVQMNLSQQSEQASERVSLGAESQWEEVCKAGQQGEVGRDGI